MKKLRWKRRLYRIYKVLKRCCLYIIFGFIVVVILYIWSIFKIKICSQSPIYVSELDTFLGIISGGIAIFSLWALVMTVFSIAKIGDIKETVDKVEEINKSMLWQHVLQLNYAGKHRSETILLCKIGTG